jgi:chemotaxis protein methyltransferase CheR
VKIDDELLDRAAHLLDVRVGLKPDPSFRPRLARAVRDVAEAMKIEREELIGSLSTDASLFDALLNRITVQESGFFRHPEQFEIVARMLLTPSRAPFRTWSAACANGQEAYSLAMIMSEAGRPGSVLASDVSPAALQRTETGSYAERELAGVSVERRIQHFVPAAGRWQVRKDMRAMISVRRHNLLDPLPPQIATCQVIMCRNVLIYFKQHHAKYFLERLADEMDPAALLFIGGAETLWQLTDRFEPVQMGASYAYRPQARGWRGRTPSSPAAVSVPARPPRTPPVPIASRATSARGAAAAQPGDDTSQDYAALGRELLASGSLQQAIVAFRRWAYLFPDDPTAHFQLGSALDAASAGTSAGRAYRAALAALDRCTDEGLADALHGFDPSELRRLIVDRCRVAVVSS